MFQICSSVEKINKNCKDILPDNNIPFRQIAGFRNYIAHEYEGLDQEMAWDIFTIELPKLLKEIEFIHKEVSKSETVDKPEEPSPRRRMR